jgi:hypothetical protein
MPHEILVQLPPSVAELTDADKGGTWDPKKVLEADESRPAPQPEKPSQTTTEREQS